jgi:acetate---CoA ligase (ADP-forming)
VPVTRERLTHTADEAAIAAAAIGYPFVLKAQSAAIPHKTGAGVVYLNLADAHPVLEAYRAIEAAVARLPGPITIDGVSVQEMARDGIEMMVGIHNDEQFGPVVVCGMGGVMVEVLRDTAQALAPVSKAEALAMLQTFKDYKTAGRISRTKAGGTGCAGRVHRAAFRSGVRSP